MHDCQSELHDTDRLTRVIARCSTTEVVLALGALVFAVGAGLLAAPIG